MTKISPRELGQVGTPNRYATEEAIMSPNHNKTASAAHVASRASVAGKTAGHHTDGEHWYADTAFINAVQYVYPRSELRHIGFGEFELVTPDGTLQFDRMRGEKFPGQSGRSHKLYDDARGKVVEKAIHLMEQKHKSERMA